MELWRLFFEEVFTIAYRSSHNHLLEGTKQEPFQVFPYSRKYWFADPMVFSWQGTDYLFYEAFDKWKDKGLIAVSTFTAEGKWSEPVIVLERPYHLSYPIIYEKNNDLYMIPETSANKTIEIYKAVTFPYEWELAKVLKDNICAVDSTPILHQGERFLFTVLEDKSTDGLSLIAYRGEDLLEHPANPLDASSATARSAGRFFYHNDQLYRPFQDCSRHEYGRALGFSIVKELSPLVYVETPCKRVSPEDITVLTQMRIRGVHTYARSSQHEIIDVKYREFYIPFKYIRFFLRRFRKWFG